jgi:hypothetical protein
MRAPHLFAAALGFVAVVSTATPASAEIAVDARAAVMSESASCSLGDIEIHYTGGGVERQRTYFTAADGRQLHRYDTRVYASSHEGVEYILSQTRNPPPAGTIVAVHVTIGASPPDAKTGEFMVAWRCDVKGNDAGGRNEVVYTCHGLFGTCLTDAKAVAAKVATNPPSTPKPDAPAAGPAKAVPSDMVRFTG